MKMAIIEIVKHLEGIMAEMTATVAETRANFSKIAPQRCAKRGDPSAVFKNSKPWVLVAPPQRSGYGDHIPSIDWAKQDVVRSIGNAPNAILPADWDDEEDDRSTVPSHDPKPERSTHVEFLDHPGIGKVRPAF